MYMVKTATFTAFRNILRKREDIYDRLLRKVSPEGREFLTQKKVAMWMSGDIEESVLNAAAHILFPQSKKKMQELGELIARESFTGVYRIFLHFGKPTLLFKAAPVLWEFFNSKGKIKVVNIKRHSGTLLLKEFPDYRQYQAELTSGYLIVVLNEIGLKNVRVELDEADKNEWKWHVKWGIAE